MHEFRQAFRQVAEEVVETLPTPANLMLGEKRDVLVVPKQTNNGFEVTLECTDVAVIPSAGEWHSGAWDVTVWEPDQLKADLRAFIRSVLSDGVLEIFYSNEKPYKWVLHYSTDDNRFFDETGLLFFNWFGRKSAKRFCNCESKN